MAWTDDPEKLMVNRFGPNWKARNFSAFEDPPAGAKPPRDTGVPVKGIADIIIKFDPKDVELLQAVSAKLDRLLEKLNA